ncbi:NUDIX hydrolase, partial [Streptomyces sp. NPDC088178]
MSLYDDAVLVLKEYENPLDPAQEALRQVYLDHLAEHPDGMWKACGAGHLTASALVVDPERGRVLLTLHRKL